MPARVTRPAGLESRCMRWTATESWPRLEVSTKSPLGWIATRPHLHRKTSGLYLRRAGSPWAYSLLPRLLPAPGHASGCPEPRPASAHQPLGPRRPATPGRATAGHPGPCHPGRCQPGPCQPGRCSRHGAARVELTREGGGERGDGLHQAERGLARAEQLGAQRRRGAREEAVDLSRDLGVVLEDGHLRGELVDDVADGPPLVEAHVARAEREAVHLDAGEHLAARRDHARLLVEVQLADHVHPQVGHECHAAAARLKHDRVRVRVALPLRLRRRVVARVVDVVLRARLHRAALLRVVRGHDAAQPAVRLHADRADRRVPVVDQQHAAAAVVDGEEARRGAARAHGRAELAQRAGLAVEREGDHLPLLLDALGARVDHVELGVAAPAARTPAGWVGVAAAAARCTG
mmetsp:Transcript_6570/g.16266  ORF Transcript_6570/g.16266 Transcript_6570/m.16266 type:complete len:406 (-) Transcript_6570:795-2012(-)